MVNYSQFNESDDAGKRDLRCFSVYVVVRLGDINKIVLLCMIVYIIISILYIL